MKNKSKVDSPVLIDGEDSVKAIHDSPHYEPVPTQVPLLLFSGGLDSTYMLFFALQRGYVDVLYIPGVVEPDKEKAEAVAREKIFAWLEENSKYKIRNKITAENFQLGDHRLLVMAQPVAWIFSSLKVVDHRIHSELQVGYVISDQAATFHHEIRTAWESLNTIAKHESVPMRFPLLKTSKSFIHESLPESLRKLTWSCEFPTKRTPRGKKFMPCGKCLPCLESSGIQAKVDFLRSLRSF